MDENTLRVSAERKMAILQRIHLVGRMTEEYCNDKKMLKSLARALKKETKKLKATKYPLTGEHLSALEYVLSEETDIVARFRRAKTADQFRLASTALGDFFAHVDQEIAETAVLLEEKSEALQKIEKAIGKARALGEKLGKEIEKGVDKLKKSIRARDSE